jgi:hypothetical protein
MDDSTRNRKLTHAEIRAILDDTERQALGGMARTAARAGLGTLAFTGALLASMDVHPVGLVLLGATLVLGLAVYIRSVARSASMKPGNSAQPARPEAMPPTAAPETTPATRPMPATAVDGIAGGSWSRLSQKQGA